MDPGYPTPVKEDNDDQEAAPKAVRSTSTRARQKRRPETSAVLGKVRVSKVKPKKQKPQTQKPKAPEFKPAIQDSDAITQSSIPQAPKRRETKEETPLRQLRPQRVSKAKRFSDASVKSSGTQPRGAGQTRSPNRARSKRRPAPQRPQPAYENAMTRSGRISKPPVSLVWFALPHVSSAPLRPSVAASSALTHPLLPIAKAEGENVPLQAGQGLDFRAGEMCTRSQMNLNGCRRPQDLGDTMFCADLVRDILYRSDRPPNIPRLALEVWKRVDTGSTERHEHWDFIFRTPQQEERLGQRMISSG
jgi:hypothetical protein